jgi:hypothetical protein
LDHSNFDCISSRCLIAIKLLLFLPMFTLAMIILITKPKDFFLMESYWGFHISWISLLLSVLSHKNKWFLSLSVHSSELAWGFNLFIVPFYWEFEWQNIYKAVKAYKTNTDERNFEYFTAVSVHTAPIVCCLVELLFTKLVFLKKDSKWNFLVGVLYIPVNYFGADIFGHPVYY